MKISQNATNCKFVWFCHTKIAQDILGKSGREGNGGKYHDTIFWLQTRQAIYAIICTKATFVVEFVDNYYGG